VNQRDIEISPCFDTPNIPFMLVLDKCGYAPSSRTFDTKTLGCGGQALYTRPSSLASSGDSYTLAGA